MRASSSGCVHPARRRHRHHPCAGFRGRDRRRASRGSGVSGLYLGTTGEPKGDDLEPNAVFQMCKAPEYLDAKPGDKSLSFLPLCHIAERMASVFNAIALGLIVHFPENSGTVPNDIREVAPHHRLCAAPVLGKMHRRSSCSCATPSPPPRAGSIAGRWSVVAPGSRLA
ncbi:MAG: AMP-binding protein [Rhodobacter sp.]|nr:AMP-binding protein [Rhodobacter sp.]